MLRRQPTHRRGISSYIVDHSNLADLVWRRCQGCSIAYHLEVAERFLEQEGFDPHDRDAVLAILRQRYERIAQQPLEPPPWRPANGSTICSRCGLPFAAHEPDPDFDELIVLCDGSRVQV